MARASSNRNFPSSREFKVMVQKIQEAIAPLATPDINHLDNTFSQPSPVLETAKMPKSAIDATRFTSTTPHASAKTPTSLSPNLSSKPNRTLGPAGETPLQKVKRLREAADRARNAKISTFDRLVIRGRVWADMAHRITALTLIGLTGVAGFVTAYALGDMIIYNRRKKREYYANQAATHEESIYKAHTAIRLGVASQEQIEMVEREESKRKALEGEDASQRPGIMARVKELLYSGLDKEGVEGYEIQQKKGRKGENAAEEHTNERSVFKAVGDHKARFSEQEEAGKLE